MPLRIAALAALLLAVPAPCPAAGSGEELFAPVEQARTEAEAAEAALLAPGSYARAVAALEDARRAYQRGRAREDVDRLLGEAEARFASASRSAAEARLTFRAALEAREAARGAEAFRLAAGSWVRADEELRDAAARLEKTDISGALKRGETARGLYDQAELEAIKASLLTEARSRVVELERGRTDRLAPRTTQRAAELLRQAEAALDGDRRQREEASRLAAEAVAEADRAVALARLLAAARDEKSTPEDMALAWEATLTRAAGAAGVGPLPVGPAAAGEALARELAGLRQRNEALAGDLAQRDRQVASLEEEIRELDQRLAGASSETRDLTEQLAARERARAQYRELEQLFSPDEAVVLRKGEDIIVRMQGLAFAPGSDRLGTAAGPMLARLGKVVNLYPGASFTVEGHTDATGDSAGNQRLSQSRAEAVRDYLVSQQQVAPGRVAAIGYGDARPVAKNDSAEGRRQNRRIDLVITPVEQAP